MRTEILEERIGFRQEGFYSEDPLTRDEIDIVRATARDYCAPGKPFTREQIEAIDRFILLHEGKRTMGPEAVPGIGWLDCRVSIKDGAAIEFYGYKEITPINAKVFYALNPGQIPNHPIFQRFPGTRAVIEYS